LLGDLQRVVVRMQDVELGHAAGLHIVRGSSEGQQDFLVVDGGFDDQVFGFVAHDKLLSLGGVIGKALLIQGGL
jgi:hypothetical protein